MTPTLKDLFALLTVALFSPAIRFLLPATVGTADTSSWLSPIIALLPLFVIIAALVTLMRAFPDLSADGIVVRLLGKWAGGAVLAIGGIWIMLTLSAELCFFARRIDDLLLPGINPFITLSVLLGVAVFTAQSGVAASTGLARIILPFLLGVFALTVAGSLAYTDTFHLLPVDLSRAARGATPSLSLLVYCLPLLLFVRGDEAHLARRLCLGSVCIALLLSAVAAVTLGLLGPVLSAELPYPYLSGIKSVEQFPFFERIESGVTAVAILSDLMMCVLLFLAMAHLPRSFSRTVSGGSVRLVLLIGLAVLSAVGAVILFNSDSLLSTVTALLTPLGTGYAVCVPLLLLAAGKLRGKI